MELTRSINFVPVLVSQQKMGRKNYFLACEFAVVNSFILSDTDKKERGEKLQTHLAYLKNLITMLRGNVTKTERPTFSSDKKTG